MVIADQCKKLSEIKHSLESAVRSISLMLLTAKYLTKDRLKSEIYSKILFRKDDSSE